MHQEINTFNEELEDARNGIEKNQILQKYGIIVPKLTESEQLTIEFELKHVDTAFSDREIS
jgi:hypothetical protein